MNRHSWSMGRIFNALSLVFFTALALWALLPPRKTVDEQNASFEQSGESVQADVEHVIRFSPGLNYMPNLTPYGIGAPLQGLAQVIQEFEQRFPDTRIEALAAPMNREYLVTQLSSGQAPDILNVNVEDVWVDIQKEWYIPLDDFLEGPNEFVREQDDSTIPGYYTWWDMFKHQAISRGKAATDGLNYCISFDIVETGIYYNKDIFRKADVEVPETWEQFMAALKKINETPIAVNDERAPRQIVPMLVNSDMLTDWCYDLFFDQLYYSLLPGIDLLQDPVREAYLQGYLDDVELYFLFNQGFFTRRDPRYSQLFRLMYDLRQYCNQNLASIDFIREFVTQRAAMLWNPCSLSYRLKGDRALGFEWDVFYLPPFTQETSPYASGSPMCVIGGSASQFEVSNSAISDTPRSMPFRERIATSKRLRRVVQFLQFMTLPENYERIVNEYECFLPNIVGVESLPALKPFEEILKRRYTTTKWAFTFDLKFYEILRRMLELYLNDGSDHDGFMQWQEDNIRAAVANLAVRKPIDEAALFQAWEERAPLRAAMEGLPDAAR